MWRLKIGDGGKDPYIFSTNNFVGRQIWEFDSEAGSEEERAQVEAARRRFSENRFKVRPCGDLLWRMQFLREKKFKQEIAPVKIEDNEEITYDKATAALRRSVHYLSALQSNDGHWPAENTGPLFFLPPMVMCLYITGHLNSVFSIEHRKEVLRYINNCQNEDGGWGLHIEGHSTMFCTVLNYVCMRLLGEGPDGGLDNACARARKWILDHGGATYIPSWGKTWLSQPNTSGVLASSYFFAYPSRLIMAAESCYYEDTENDTEFNPEIDDQLPLKQSYNKYDNGGEQDIDLLAWAGQSVPIVFPCAFEDWVILEREHKKILWSKIMAELIDSRERIKVATKENALKKARYDELLEKYEKVVTNSEKEERDLKVDDIEVEDYGGPTISLSEPESDFSWTEEDRWLCATDKLVKDWVIAKGNEQNNHITEYSKTDRSSIRAPVNHSYGRKRESTSNLHTQNKRGVAVVNQLKGAAKTSKIKVLRREVPKDGLNKDIPSYLFGRPYEGMNTDLKAITDFLDLQEVEGSIMTIYCWLKDMNLRKDDRSHLYGFANPQTITKSHNNIEFTSNQLSYAMQNNHCPGKLTFAPYVFQRHWTLIILDPDNMRCSWLDPLNNTIPDHAIQLVDLALSKFRVSMNIYRYNACPKHFVRCPKQPHGTLHCGYYVMKFIDHIIESGLTSFGMFLDNQRLLSHYTIEELRPQRFIVAQYLLLQINRAKQLEDQVDITQR